MKLDYVDMAGFRSCCEQLRIEFGSGLTVITGRNGVGKSTIMDAVEFALTGTISKYKIEKAKGGGLAEHTWWVGDQSAKQNYVEVGFSTDAGEKIVARRTPTGPTSDFGRLQTLLLNSNPDPSLTLEKLCQTMILRDEQISELSLDLSERQRFQAVLDAISPDTAPDIATKLDDVVRLANSDAKAARDEQESLKLRLSGRLEDLAGLRGSLPGRDALSAAEDDRRQAENDLRALIPSLRTDSDSALASLASYFSAARELRDSLESFLGRASQDSIAVGNDRLEKLNNEIADRIRQIETLRELRLADESTKQQLSGASEAYQHLALLLEHGDAHGLEDGHCPLCNASRTESEFAQSIKTQRARIGEAEQRLAEVQARLSATTERLRVLEDEFSMLQRQKENLQERIRSHQAEEARLSAEAGRLGLSELANDLLAFDERLEQIRLLNSRLRDSSARLTSFQSVTRIESLETEIAQLRTRLDELAGQIAAKEAAADRAKSLNALSKAFPREILEEQFETVMPLLKELYRRLRPHLDWNEIDYDFGGKVLASLNFQVGDGKNPQFLFSSGQRRATGLAFLLAVHLSREWTSLRTLMLDDPVQHIDDYRALNLVEVLAAIRREHRQVIVAVEDPSLAELLARRLRGHPDDDDMLYEIATSDHGGSFLRAARHLPPFSLSVLAPAQVS